MSRMDDMIDLMDKFSRRKEADPVLYGVDEWVSRRCAFRGWIGGVFSSGDRGLNGNKTLHIDQEPDNIANFENSNYTILLNIR